MKNLTKIKKTVLTFLLVSNGAFAAPACDGFLISLNNKLAEDLMVTSIKLEGAVIQPAGVESLKAHSIETFTVNASSDDVPMNGEFILHTVSLPSKTVKINYTLDAHTLACHHTDTSPLSDYDIEKSRKVGEVSYTIINR